MSDEDAELEIIPSYEGEGFPCVSYLDKDASIIQAVGNLIAQVGKCPPKHPIVAPAIEWLQNVKPPQLKSIRGGKD